MASSIVYRLIEPGQCAAVVELHRRVFPPEEVCRTIFGATGIVRYLENVLRFPRKGGDEHVLWGAWDGEQLIGYQYVRALPTSWHFNYQAVLASHQGQGVGRRFSALGIEGVRERGYRMISLDVAASNRILFERYKARGYQVVETTWIYDKRLEPGDASWPAEAQLHDWELAEALQTAYGFSQFNVSYQGSTWRVGRLGETFFRVSQPLPAPLEALLARIDPRHRLLILSSRPCPELEEIAVSFRMQRDVGEATG